MCHKISTFQNHELILKFSVIRESEFLVTLKYLWRNTIFSISLILSKNLHTSS